MRTIERSSAFKRDLVSATMGFERLADETKKPSKSLHRMLSARGNPSMNNLTQIFAALRHKLNVDINVQVTPA